ncbi:MAG: hypothetical protein FWC13_12515 [Oscillospiraceae bacterium]|nr:hypothetical protein [Oscillospiraceae bacterium]
MQYIEVDGAVSSIPDEISLPDLTASNQAIAVLGDEAEPMDMLINDLYVYDASIVGEYEELLSDVFDGVEMPDVNNALNARGGARMASRANNGPNSAIFIADPLKNMWLNNVSTANESWYFFFGDADSKLTLALYQPTNSIYVTLLYRLNGNMLDFVSSSMYGANRRQQFSHLMTDDNDVYFLRIVPLVPANSIYYFIIHTTATFDAAEPDDNIEDATVIALPAVRNQTIDNPLDIDWFRFSTGNANSFRFALTNVPAGASYALRLFDGNMNQIASFSSSGSAQRDWPLPRNTTFYVEIHSLNGGFSATQNYRLSIQPLGNQVTINGNQLTVNGNPVNLNGTFWSNNAGTAPTGNNAIIRRSQSVAAGTGGVQILGRVEINGVDHGTYSGHVFNNPVFRHINYNNVIFVRVTNIHFLYFFSHTVNGVAVEMFSIPIPVAAPYSVRLVICADTGRVVDVPDLNWLYHHYGNTPRVNGQPFLR